MYDCMINVLILNVILTLDNKVEMDTKFIIQ